MKQNKFDAAKAAIERCAAPVELYAAIKALREKKHRLEHAIKQIKELDELIRDRLLIYLDANAMKTANFEGLGSVTKTVRQRAEIRDYEKLACFVANALQHSQDTGLSPEEALSVFQRRLAVGNIQTLEKQGYKLADMGVEVVDVFDVAIRMNKTGETK